MVTRACHRPSLPRYREEVDSCAAIRRLPFATIAEGGQEAVGLDALDPDGASDMDDVQLPGGDLALDRSAGAARVGGDLPERQQ